MAKHDRQKIEFGDFQTPDALAGEVVAVLKSRGVAPRSIVEPTCGLGAFVVAAIRGFDSAREIIALEINAEYFAKADARCLLEKARPRLDLRRADFFSFDWRSVVRDLPQPVLLLGNPPWVTSAGLGAINGTNLPEKSNFQGHQGLDAITGKGNFDIAEWMLIKLLEAASGTNATLAMLVKTSTARRVLAHAWRSGLHIHRSAIFGVDAAKHFDVGVSACLLVCELTDGPVSTECDVFDLSEPQTRLDTIGFRGGGLVADVHAFDRVQHLIMKDAETSAFRWRSGIKHDCSTVMELRGTDPQHLTNGMKDEVCLESQFVYPMMKGSEVAGGTERWSHRWMIVPQRTTGDDTSLLESLAPRTWAYLNKHGAALDRRGSSIYRKRPRFAVFGIGPYSFAPWKVAVCGLYKRVEFSVIGPEAGRPVVFDDTVNHLSFDTEADARAVAEFLRSPEATDFFDAMVFRDSKRPITVDLLKRLNIGAIARLRGTEINPSELPGDPLLITR